MGHCCDAQFTQVKTGPPRRVSRPQPCNCDMSMPEARQFTRMPPDALGLTSLQFDLVTQQSVEEDVAVPVGFLGDDAGVDVGEAVAEVSRGCG